ncbi:MAG: DUF4340 domain-containing protein [Pseudomonadota bacterium]
MNFKLITVLGLAILVMVLAVAFTREGENEAGEQRVFPGLEARLAQLDKIELASPDASTTLVRQDSAWVVSERADYPADFDKLSELVRGMAEARFIEQKTARAENHALLGVTGLDEAASDAVLVRAAAGTDSFALLFGNESEAGQGIFARFPDDNQVWLVTRQTKPSAAPSAWIRPVALNLDAERVASVRHVNPEGELLVTRDSESGDFTVENLPSGAELQYATVANTLSRALVNLRATDVRQRGGQPWNPDITATFTLTDGGTIQVTGKTENADYWLQIDETAGEGDSSEVIGAVAGNYQFRVAEYTFSQFRKSMKDMIRSEAEEQTSEED